MSQENVVTDEIRVDNVSNGDTNGVEQANSPPASDNCEDSRHDAAYSASPRTNRKIFVGALTPETTERKLMPFF